MSMQPGSSTSGPRATWSEAFGRAAVSGCVASVTSTAALALLGRAENGSAVAPTNAISHWLWGDRALRRDRPTVRHTATGYAIHHAASIFWAVLFEKYRTDRVVRDAAVTSTLACLVDFKLTPHRLTPGFEHRLSRRSLATVYGAFALGLALGAVFSRARHADRSSSRRER
jgi:hypothetical protein